MSVWTLLLQTIKWLSCDDCGTWFHLQCLGMDISDSKAEALQFTCSKCAGDWSLCHPEICFLIKPLQFGQQHCQGQECLKTVKPLLVFPTRGFGVAGTIWNLQGGLNHPVNFLRPCQNSYWSPKCFEWEKKMPAIQWQVCHNMLPAWSPVLGFDRRPTHCVLCMNMTSLMCHAALPQKTQPRTLRCIWCDSNFFCYSLF